MTGAHGVIGTALVRSLESAGHEVTRLVRSAPEAEDVLWDPAAGTVKAKALEGVDAVVHLAGVGFGEHRWSARHKRAIRDSRVRGTDLLARTLASLSWPPRVFLSASAGAYYGSRGDEELTEDSGPGGGFLASVVQEWEEATAPAEEAGIRTVLLRSGDVLSTANRVFMNQVHALKGGVGGRVSTGGHWQSWITVDDHVAAIRHLMAAEDLWGPVNVTSPNPVTNAEFTATQGAVLRRPTAVSVPALAVQVLMGPERASELALASRRMVPAVLQASGFDFSAPDLQSALREVLG